VLELAEVMYTRASKNGPQDSYSVVPATAEIDKVEFDRGKINRRSSKEANDGGITAWEGSRNQPFPQGIDGAT